MGKKIFGIYLAKLDAPNSEAHARLELPASPLELHDAMDKVQLQENEELYLEIDDYYGFEYLAPHLMELDASLNELNDLAGRLAVLDETEQEAFDGLLRLEIQRKVESNGSILTMQDLRTLAVSAGADCCHVVGATSDAELGRFYAENGFMEELDGLSDDVFEMLDFGKIGKALRTGENGTFTRSGYVVKHSELVTAPPCAKELPEKPEYLFRLTLGLHPDLEDDRTVTLELPASAEALREVQKQLGADGWEGAMVLDYDGIIPQAAEFADLPMELDAFNDFAEAVEAMLKHEDELSSIVEKYRSKTPKARYLDFNQGVDGRKINDDNMTQLARLAIKPLRIAFDDIKLKDTYCAAVRTAHRHGIKEISNYILFNYKDKPEDLYERLKINIELNRELGIQIFSFPMKYSPINRTDRSYIGVNWTKKSIRAISAILQVTKGVVAAGSDFFYKAFGNTLEEYFELLAMPRELIMFRHHFEENGTTAEWKKLYQSMSDEQKKELMEFTSHTVAELKQTPCPEQFREILPYYLIKYNGKKEQMGDGAVQLSLMDDSDIVVEDQ